VNLIYVDPRSKGKLLQAGVREIPNIISKNDIYMLIFAAKEIQPSQMPFVTSDVFNKIRKFYIPLDDSNKLTQSELNIIDRVADLAADSIRNGKCVLSTCRLGLNRSGLFSGVILKKLTDAPSPNIIYHIKKYRHPRALSNKFFQQLLIGYN